MSSRPKAPRASGYVVKCNRCDVPFPSQVIDSDGIGYCVNCGWKKGYKGADRQNQCLTCFNHTGFDKKGNVLCAALMYQMADGTWRDRSNQAQRCHFVDTGMRKICKPITPDARPSPEYECECYENIEGKSREYIARFDPENFYSRKRFW